MTGNAAVPYEEPLDLLFQFASRNIYHIISSSLVGKKCCQHLLQTYNRTFCPIAGNMLCHLAQIVEKYRGPPNRGLLGKWVVDA